MTGLSARSFYVFLNQLGDVLDARNLRGLALLKRLRVFFVTGTVGPVTPPTRFRVELLGAK